MLKIAFCLYGQPREYSKGYESIRKFLDRHDDIEVDFYFHTWIPEAREEGAYFEASPWRKINRDSLRAESDAISKLNALYKPVDFSCHSPIVFRYEGLKNSICYKNTVNPRKIANINNTLSQMYSRNTVRDLLEQNLAGRDYELVITTRFDHLKDVKLDLHKIDPQKFYVSDQLLPRKILPDNFAVTGIDNYLKIYNIYRDLPRMANDSALDREVKEHGEVFELNAEELLFASYLYQFGNVDKVVYTDLIPCFP